MRPLLLRAKIPTAPAPSLLLCAIHCALMPVLISTLPSPGLSLLACEPVEWELVACNAILGALAFGWPSLAFGALHKIVELR